VSYSNIEINDDVTSGDHQTSFLYVINNCKIIHKDFKKHYSTPK